MSIRFLIAMAILSMATLPANAQRATCGEGAGLIAHLEKEWGEEPAVMAMDAAGRMVRILANPESGTWTMLLTGPGGPTCLVQHGSAWESLTPPTDPGDPS